MIYLAQPENFNPLFEVVSCFCEHDGKILLLHREKHKSQPDTWGAPAGKIEKNETPHQAIIREILEETGLSISLENLTLHRKIFVRYESHDFIYYIFHTQISHLSTIKISALEHQNFCWKTPQDALKLPLVQDMDACIKLFFKI